jgi:hypothetical protein
MCIFARNAPVAKGEIEPMFRVIGRVFYGLSVGSVALSLVLWLQRQQRPKGIAQLLWRPNYDAAERAGTFVGLWAPTLAIAGKVFEDMDAKSRQSTGNANGRYVSEAEKSLSGRS